MNRKFDFDDINLVPKFCIVGSRSECDTSVEFGGKKFKLPVVPANMECIISEDLAIKLSENGYFYIMHRFGVDNIKFISDMKKLGLISSISIGVNRDSYVQLDEMVKLNIIPDFITIDIAHGHSIKMKNILDYITKLKIKSYIIAGNVSTPDAIEDMAEWGADCAKVGIGPGCFIPTSVVKTKDGIKKLSDIIEGDYVITHKNRYRKVLKKESYIGEQDLIKINDMPPCTETHEFYVIEESKKDIVNENNILEYAFWVKAKDLDKNIHLLVKV